MAEICIERVAVTTTGSNGSATGSTNSTPLNGLLYSIYLDFHADAPSSTDTTVAYATRGGNIMTETDSKTDAMYHPRAKAVDNADAAITNSHDHFPLCDELTVSVAGCNALTNAVVAYIYYLRP